MCCGHTTMAYYSSPQLAQPSAPPLTTLITIMSRQWRCSNWGGFPRPQISPSFAKEAYQAVAYSQFGGEPVGQTVGACDGRQLTLLCSQSTQRTGARDTIYQDCSLQRMGTIWGRAKSLLFLIFAVT